MSRSRRPTVFIEPRWEQYRGTRPVGAPPGMYSWLRDSGSLTARLKSSCKKHFAVHLMRQEWGKPSYSEASLLAARPDRIAMIREVELNCDGVAWVFARTVIPVSGLFGPLRGLVTLGTKPLGEVLFADPCVKRNAIEIARLQPKHRLFHTAVRSLRVPPGEIWGRRTLFQLAGAPLLVNEIFLPTIPC